MSNIEPRPIDPTLQAAQPRALSSNDLTSRVLEGVSPLRSGRAIRQIERDRAKLAVDVSRVEHRMLLAEAIIIAQAKVRSTEAHAEALLHAERVEIVADAAIRHEQASRVIDLVKDEQTHTLFKDALNGTSARYLGGVIKRAGS